MESSELPNEKKLHVKIIGHYLQPVLKFRCFF